MNSFAPNLPNQLGSISPIEGDMWFESIHAENRNWNNQHILSRSLCEKSNQLVVAKTQPNIDPDSILDIITPRQKCQASSFEYRSTKDDESIIEFCPSNFFEFEQEASSLGLLQIENMVREKKTTKNSIMHI